MIQSTINGTKWIRNVMQKLTSFADKCPLLLNISSGLYHGIDGVYIEVRGSERKYFFKWAIGEDPKKFVHNIKIKLLQEYPRVKEILYTERPATAMDVAKEIEQGVPLNETSKVVRTYKGYIVWRIEKVLSWKEIFILYPEAHYDENNVKVPFNEPKQYRYQYNGSAILYLTKYRSGRFSDNDEASREFFRNASLINTLNIKEN